MKRVITRFLPPAVKKRLKKVVRYDLWQARRLAANAKRLDICAAQFAHVLHVSGHPPLEGKVCLEVGAGWVLTHALVCYLLGAQRVIATDIVPHAHPQVIEVALKHSLPYLPPDILAPFADHADIRARMTTLLTLEKYDFESLRHLGLAYVSPVDFAREKLDAKADFIYSFWVLGGVPCDDLPPLLANLSEMLSPGGTMFHAIHLEDLGDYQHCPFDFLNVPEDNYSRELQAARGNRIRCSEWLELFGEIPQTASTPLFIYHRRDIPLPECVDPSITHVCEDDLRVSHLGILTQKLA